ncbi:MAG TPA: protein kinase, partial [Pseudonocardia sp.]|nr:protein kinase [Pseudonocardia sp.]
MTGDHLPPPTPGRTAVVEELARAGFVGAVEVGRGGFGVVYRCHQQALGRTVAIKLLHTDLDTVSRERFFREGRAMGGLSGHPNVVDVLQVGVTESGRPYIVMPFQALDSLAQRVRREGPVPWPDAVRLGVRLAGALETAHRVGTLHRDVKPANILMSDYGEPQLTDFGIARIDGGFETATGAFTGSLSYTAPEVLNGRPPSAASDVYGLGAALFTIIAGQSAYERREGEEIVAQYLRITGQPVPDLRPIGVPDDLASLLERAMAKDPALRPGSAEQFGRELQAVQRAHGLPVAEMALPVVPRHALVDQDPEVTELAQAPGEVAPHPHTADPFGRTELAPRPGPRPEFSGPRPEFSGPRPEFSGPRPEFSGPRPELSPPGLAYAHRSGPHSGPSGGEVSGPPLPPARPARRWLPVAIAVGTVTVLLVALTVGGVLLLRRGESPSAPPAAAASDPAPVSAWRPLRDAPTPRQQVAATVADGTVWVLGGLTDTGASTAVENYDPAINTWKSGIPLPVPLHHAMAVTYRGEIVVFGGWLPEGPDLTAVTSDKVYAQRGGGWVELPPMPSPRAAGAAVVVGDEIVVTGGQADDELVPSTVVFDGERWRTADDLPTPREHLAMVTDGGYAYAVGGRDLSADRNSAALERYDPATGAWERLADMPSPRGGIGAAVVDGRIVVVGGEDPTRVIADVDGYDLKSGTWAALPPMPTPRHGMAVAGVGDTVYTLGGATDPSHAASSAVGEALDVPQRRAQPAGEWRAAKDAPLARQFSASTVAGGTLWVAGGLEAGDVTAATQGYDPAIDTWKSG